MNGVLVVDKPAGPTSHDVVDRVRRALGVRRVGHTGTLDPFATGVLPMCVGRATRLARFLAEGEKRYRASVRLGFATSTDDLTGEPLGLSRPVALSEAAVREACRRWTGPILQVPPAYSAKRIDGERSYRLARQGVEVDRRAAPVQVHRLDVLELHADRLELDVRCSPGTYVRALARDLGESLGVGAHLTALRRTCSGGFGLEAAVAWDDLDAEAGRRLLPMARLLTELPAVTVTAEGLAALRHGRALSPALVAAGFPERPPARMRVLGPDGELVALAVPRGFEAPAPPLRADPVLHPDIMLAG